MMCLAPANRRMFDPATFQRAFGAALAGHATPWLADPAIARALTVHRNTSIKAACDALAANYPVVRKLVGSEAFARCASDFVEVDAPAEPRLCLYGAGFGSFLAQYGPFADVHYLPDVAMLERLVTEVLFAADAPIFDGSDFAIDRPLLAHPASRVASFVSPAGAIWSAHQPDAEPDALGHIVWAPGAVIVTRPESGILVSPVDAPTAVFMGHCLAGATLGNAATAAAEAGGEVSSIFATLLTIGAFRAPESKEKLDG